MSSDAERVAALAGAAMYGRNRASQSLRMVLEETRPGYARVRMPVRADMLNGHGTCHGGIVFALADSAFAFACKLPRHGHGRRGLQHRVPRTRTRGG